MLSHLLHALGAVGNVLDLPGSSVRDVLAGQNPFDQYLSPLSGANRTSGRDLLRHHGLIGHQDTWGNFAGGLAAEALLDPLNLVSGNALLKLGRLRHAATAENAAIRSSNALSMAQRAAGYMPEEIAHLSALKGPSGLPQKMYHGTHTAYEAIDPGKWDQTALYGAGHYMTDSPHVASSYAKPSQIPLPEHEIAQHFAPGTMFGEHTKVLGFNPATAESPWSATVQTLRRDGTPFGAPATITKPPVVPSSANVMAHYVDTRKPFNVHAEHSLEELQRIAPGFAGKTGDNLLGHVGGANALHQKLREAGYDSVMYADKTGGHTHNVLVAQDPAQVYKPFIATEIQKHKGLPSYKPAAKGTAAHNALARSRSQ